MIYISGYKGWRATIETQDINKLLYLGGCVTASPITANVTISKVDDGRPFAGNFKDAVWLNHHWHPHEPISTKHRTNPVFWISGLSRVSITYNGQSCIFIIWSVTDVISRRGDGVEWICLNIWHLGLSLTIRKMTGTWFSQLVFVTSKHCDTPLAPYI